LRVAGSVALVGVVLAIVAAVAAFAAAGYSVSVRTSPRAVAIGHSFTVKAHGVAGQKALLYVYLDHKRCRKTANAEASRVNRQTYTSGQSYFTLHDGSPPKEPYDYAWVTGSFAKSFTAHAGTTAQREFVCAYLATPNSYGGYRITAAHTWARYTVTN